LFSDGYGLEFQKAQTYRPVRIQHINFILTPRYIPDCQRKSQRANGPQQSGGPFVRWTDGLAGI